MDGSCKKWEDWKLLSYWKSIPRKKLNINGTVPFFELEIIYLYSWVLFYCQLLVVFGCETDFIDR